MKKRLTVALAALVGLIVSMMVFIQPASAAVGLRVSGDRIVEANGSNFVIRGVSHPHVWYTSQTNSFRDIKALGANTVRVVLGSGQRWGPSNDIPTIVNLCRTNRLVCVLEAHDTTGYGEEGAAATLDQAASYWISQRSALAGTENFIIINIGNEPFGNNESVSATWPTATSNAITRLRGAGFEHMIMVDAPMWGQDWRFIMRDNARTVFNSDPQRNTVFSIHMYGVFDTPAEITDYLVRFRTAGLPIVVGEFGHDHSDGNPDEDTIMSYTQQYGIGYIGWSWSGNSGGVEYLDMVTNFNPSQLTSWGTRIFNGTNGIRQTAREATYFSGATQPPVTTPPATTRPPTTPPGTTRPPTTPPATTRPPTTPPVAGGCTATVSVQSWSGGFVATVRVTAGSSGTNGWSVGITLPSGATVTNSWNATPSGTSGTVRFANVSYNGRLGAGQTTEFGFQGSGTPGSLTPTCTAT